MLGTAVTGCARATSPSSTTRSTLTEADRNLQAELIQNALDGEALYTIASGLKPVSTGIWSGQFLVNNPDLTELRRVRRALATIPADGLYFDVQVFATAYDDERFLEAYVVHREALAKMIDKHADFWSPYGITSQTHPAELLAVVDRMDKLDRFRGYGLLFGYPAHAIDFFVDAAAEEDRTGNFIERDFFQIPTFASDTGRFTYAVPKGHLAREEDK
ncbi:MAG: hypothetical protein AAGK78_03025, partial [Planctomycetota bacterium]